MMLRSRGFLGVRLAASRIEEPSLESRTRLVRKRLLKRCVILGGSRRASGCESRRHGGRRLAA